MLAPSALGLEKPESLRVVENAREALDDDVPLVELIRAALRECPR